ncbi:RagB/SusD family nutrient uptake outer membrane protein [Echinicola strongylocentroti]|uniref:RagB/SusD family nutrient uptake outer membrane protein n=1 Tax=Echinicola strongylocentroti TaxID=1795355 RepID=A0A2Z4IRF7_9BACT|nr:RagB/SusD family nutrient uptake outer membrane protein [Echinicola strongylocentroti]AWW33299.1 RagB/SusD family nutrient uptake outer membrane protein [Echinicola strongylocentroti]
MERYRFKNKFSQVLLACSIGLGLTVLPSCEGFLDEEVIANIGDDYLNTPNGLRDGVNSAYSTFRSFYGTERGNNLTVFGTDTYTNGSDGSWKFMNEYTSQFDSRNGHVTDVWNFFYDGINTCNAIIDRAPSVEGIEEDLRAQYVAEAKFIRAHHYFILTQHFGGVDLQLSETLLPTNEVSRSSVADMYSAIIADLEAAIPDLEPEMRASQYGKATRPAAEHLLGWVYLTKGYSEVAEGSDFANAEAQLQKVINDYGFQLLPDFADVHAFGNEINDEVIFSIQYTSDPLTNGGGNNTHLYFLMEYDVQPGMQRDVENGRPWKRYRPTEYTLNEVFANRDVDARYQKSFKDVFYSNTPGEYNTTFDLSKSTVNYNEGDTAIYIPGYEIPEAERATKPYQILTPSMYTDKLYPTLNKHLDPGRQDKTQGAGVRDYIAFRLADTYLLLAEAQFQQDKITEATETLNVIRRRAAWPGMESEMEIATTDLDLDFIMEERARELLGEQKRWMDLVRWGVLVERVQMHNDKGAPNIKPTHILRPIPQNQIDRVAGGSDAFPQNPGY